MVLMQLRKNSQFFILLILTVFFSQYVLAAVNCCMQENGVVESHHANQHSHHNMANSERLETVEMPCHSEIEQYQHDNKASHHQHSENSKDECCDNDCGCVNGTVSSLYLTSDTDGFFVSLNHQSQYLYSLDTLAPIQHALFKPPIIAAA